jgi:hypothetical protein
MLAAEEVLSLSLAGCAASFLKKDGKTGKPPKPGAITR